MENTNLKTPKKSTFTDHKKYSYSTMRYRNLTLLLFLCIATSVAAQTGNVSIAQDPQIGKLLDIYSKSNAEANYYTIQVGFGSYDMAQTLKDEVELDFPKWTAKIVFDSPTYRVHVGRFRDRLEAEREFLEVRKKYPGALLLKPGDRE